MRPLVSVIMPVYNGQDVVAVAAKSILNQTLRDLELLVVDDGSTDDTAAIVQSIAKIDHRIRLIRNRANYGISVSLNTAVEAAGGTYFARQDADDASHRERLERQVRAIRTTCVDVLGTAVKYFRSPIETADWVVRDASDDVDYVSVRYGNVLTHGSVLSPQHIFKTYPYSERFSGADDFELWLRLEEAGCTLGRLRVPLYGHHIPISHRRAFEYYLGALRVMKRYTAYRVQGTGVLRPLCRSLVTNANACYRLSYTVDSGLLSTCLKMLSYSLYPPALFPYFERIADRLVKTRSEPVHKGSCDLVPRQDERNKALKEPD